MIEREHMITRSAIMKSVVEQGYRGKEAFDIAREWWKWITTDKTSYDERGETGSTAPHDKS